MDSKTMTTQSKNYRRIEQAIEFLASNFQEQPDLEEMAARLNLSKYHFQRIFKEWAGVTPIQFLRYLTIAYAKERLKESQSVLETSLDSGLSSPGRLHELFITFEAMTPGEYKARGVGLDIDFGYHETPFGRCLIATTRRGICALRFLSQGDRGGILNELRREWPLANFVESPEKTKTVTEDLFSDREKDGSKEIRLFLKGTNFQVKVWEALLMVPPGMLTCYSHLAAIVGEPAAARAVANAVARNPIAYLIPCHRVIRKVGQIHGYRWGIARKKVMIGWEAVKFDSKDV